MRIGLRWCSEKPLRAGCRDQTEGNISCTVAASLHPHAHPAHSHVCTLVISAGGCACTIVRDKRVSVCISHSLSPSFIPLPVILFASLFCSFFQSLPPYFDLCLLLSPTRSQSQKHAHAPIYPPTQTVGTAESLTSSTVWRGVMQRNPKISAVPLLNLVSMATKGARPCDAVSNTQRILNLSKEISFVCWWWDVVS